MSDLLNFLISEAEHPFSGWDFSWIRDRMVAAPLDWSYTSTLLPYKHAAKAMLDLGTGGGEMIKRVHRIDRTPFFDRSEKIET